ncbi:Hydrogen peroxide induced protein 1 [Quillaja saponaria]|uniref:Hydrogen peroxide induced protein 1 n=1 Tax=Quillaja saponaria TaxID=32244 RepID=A0AAD7QLW1_QUISA|nr:Hydrogen peroxide induced protein 1 [Quillaja saponaria]
MAANSKSRGIANLGKRVVNQIWTSNSRDPSHSVSALTFRRTVHTVYDKNPDDQIHHSVVPDDVIQPESDKYWAPHPQTGVFGPSSEQSPAATVGEDRSFRSSSSSSEAANAGTGDSVLEQKAWFRPTSIEDFERPHPQS